MGKIQRDRESRIGGVVLASVVIRAKNEARYIGEVLSALFEQVAANPFEVIVVDSGSTDATLGIIKRYPVKLIEMAPGTFTYGRALNLGIQEASGDFVASLSAHSTPTSERWLANLIEPFKNPRVAGVIGRQMPRPNATSLELLNMRYISGLMSERPQLRDRNPMFSNANGALRRSLWQRLPFDEGVKGAEDIAWARSMQGLGYLIAYEPSAAVYHSHGEPFSKHVRRIMNDSPTVLGNVLGLGSDRDSKKNLKARALPEK
jgi:rhamnosyltransferase